MASWIGQNKDSRKHERANMSIPRAQKMFGIIRDLYRKINRLKPGTVLPTYETAKVLKDYRRELEERRSEAVAHWYRYKASSC